MEHESIFHDPLAGFEAYELNRAPSQDLGDKPRNRIHPQKVRSSPKRRLEALNAVSQDLIRLASRNSSAKQ